MFSYNLLYIEEPQEEGLFFCPYVFSGSQKQRKEMTRRGFFL
jgi:hypothetical protein